MSAFFRVVALRRISTPPTHTQTFSRAAGDRAAGESVAGRVRGKRPEGAIHSPEAHYLMCGGGVFSLDCIYIVLFAFFPEIQILVIIVFPPPLL